MTLNQNQSEEYQKLPVVVSKIFLYICLAIASCFWVSSCRLDENIITSCKTSCKTYNSHMISVTARECECASLPLAPEQRTPDMWVLPN